MSDSLQQLLLQHQIKSNGKYISQEFQDYAYRLAMELSNPEDRETISLCMRLAKTKPRGLLETARSFISDAPAKNKVALFLWKIQQLEKEKKETTPTEEQPSLF